MLKIFPAFLFTLALASPLFGYQCRTDNPNVNVTFSPNTSPSITVNKKGVEYHFYTPVTEYHVPPRVAGPGQYEFHMRSEDGQFLSVSGSIRFGTVSLSGNALLDIPESEELSLSCN